MTTFLVCAWLLAAAAHSTDAATTDPRGLLGALCQAHQSEPVCAKLDTITEDDAWLVLRTACRAASETSEACNTFRKHAEPVLILDADTGKWEVQREATLWPLKFDVKGVPTLRLKPHDAPELKIQVTNLSPLAYSAKAGTPSEEDLGIIADLKAVLALAGTGIQALIAVSSYSPPAPPMASVRDIPKASRGGRGGAAISRESEQPAAPRCDPPQVASLARAVGDRNVKLLDLNAALHGVALELDRVSAARDGFVSVVQRAERGAPVRSSDLVGPDAAKLNAAYAGVDAAAAPLEAGSAALATCQPVMSAYSALLSSPSDAAVVTALAKEVRRRAGKCWLDEALTRDAASLVCTADRDPAKLEPQLKLHAAAMKPFVDRLTKPEQAEDSLWKAVNDARAAKPKILAGIDTLGLQIDRGLVHSWNGMLIRALAVTRPNPELSWSKVQTQSIVIKADSPYAKEVTLAHEAEETHEYKLESAAGQLIGYSVGVVYTPLHQSTWSAVTPADGQTKVIAETKRESRAGDVAAFVTYRPMEHRPRDRTLWVQPTVDFGVGLSGVTAFFVGGGVEVFRAARISAGWSPQRVTVLADQKPGDPVASTDDIKTRDRFDRKNWYVSFSFALDSLSLFSKK